MLMLHLRTVAFICSLSTTMQSIVWIAGYVLYIIAYGCGYSKVEFDKVSSNSSISFADFFISYFQGSDCSVSDDWINETRGQSPNLLVSLVSVGLAFNTSLLTMSITTLIALNNSHNVRLYASGIKIYASAIYLVSFWDALLVAFVAADIIPILKSSDLPVFSAVASIILLIFSRFIILWIFNIMFATILLFKNESDVGATSRASNKSLPNDQINKTWNKGVNGNLPTVSEGEKEYFPKNNVIPRRMVSPPPAQDSLNEVPLRWIQYTGNGQPNHNEQPNHHLRADNDCQSTLNRTASSISSRDENNISDKASLSDIEAFIQNSLHKWKFPPTQEPNTESVAVRDVQPPTAPAKRSSFVRNVRNSFRTKSAEIVSPVEPIDDEPQTIPTKSIEGFSYIPNSNPFNVKLRHVSRPSMSEESGRNEGENSAGNGGEELFYKVSTVTDRNDVYIPRVPPVPTVPAPLYSSQTPHSKPANNPPPPTSPPVQPSLKDNAPRQMSLQEAIRTRGPLKSVKRPAIDTSC